MYYFVYWFQLEVEIDIFFIKSSEVKIEIQFKEYKSNTSNFYIIIGKFSNKQ